MPDGGEPERLVADRATAFRAGARPGAHRRPVGPGTVAADGDPLRITIEVPGEVAVGSAWRLDLEITALGDTVVIDAPDGEMPSVTFGPTPDEVRAAGIAAPVELGRLPDGWLLSSINLQEDDQQPSCTWLNLTYDDLDRQAGGPNPILSLLVMPANCAEWLDPVDDPVPMQAGRFIGEASLFSTGFDGGLVVQRLPQRRERPCGSRPCSSGDEVRVLLGSLEPFDPGVAPTEG